MDSDSDQEKTEIAKLDAKIDQFAPKTPGQPDTKESARAVPTTIQLFVDRIRVRTIRCLRVPLNAQLICCYVRCDDINQAPELLYEPAIIGLDQAGIAESLHRLLANLNTNDQSSVVKVIRSF